MKGTLSFSLKSVKCSGMYTYVEIKTIGGFNLDNRKHNAECARNKRNSVKTRLHIQNVLCMCPADASFRMLVLLLVSIGLITLLSASYPTAFSKTGDAYYYAKRQLRYAFLGILLMEGISRLNYQILRHWAKPLLIIAILLLIAVLVPWIGVVRNNSRRWIELFGIITFQPSEVAKFAVVLDFSASISTKKEKMQNFSTGVFPYLRTLAIIGLLMIKEPHLSGLILILSVGAALMFVGGIKNRWVVLCILGGVTGALLLLTGKISYGQSRIAMWKDPFIDVRGDGYQLSQSLIAIGSGGLWGLGFGRSRQKYLYLPEVQNDFIFSIVCEEMGLIGATLVLSVFAALILKGFLIACNAPDRFGALLCVGFITLFAVQTFLNVAVVTGLLPTTGISLPLFSYGGTALVMQLLELGIVLSVSRQVQHDRSGKTRSSIVQQPDLRRDKHE